MYKIIEIWNKFNKNVLENDFARKGSNSSGKKHNSSKESLESAFTTFPFDSVFSGYRIPGKVGDP